MDAAVVIRAARRRAGLSLRELAKRAGTSHSTLSAYEQGDKVPRTDTLIRICLAAGWALDWRFSPRLADPDRLERGEELIEVLELADAFPLRRSGPLDLPVFGRVEDDP
jgi:transcriptional regulator with XRE-family HTH domain